MIEIKLREAVLKEAKLLKKNATEQQLDALDFKILNGSNTTLCIYGQMTGCCFSPEAHNLILKCAVPWSDDLLSCKVREKPKNGLENRASRSFTAIEHYICRKGANNKDLIYYLKGKRKKLTVEDL